MRRGTGDPPPSGHRTKGDKASRKRMATVATVYTVDRHVRTPEEIVELPGSYTGRYLERLLKR